MSVLQGQDNRVWVAVRERYAPESESCCEIERNRIDILGATRGGREQEGTSFFFDAAFAGNTTQAEVWRRLQPKLMRCVLRQEHACILAYGQTGSGKTHTMFGNVEVAGGAGIAFRLVQSLADVVRQWQGPEPTPSVEVSFLEVYNEKVYDLFAERSVCTVSGGSAQDAARRRCNPARLEEQVTAWFLEGAATRSSGQTVLNAQSSRSHAVATLHLSWGPSPSRETRLYLVDLAGSERAGAYALSAEQLREGVHINKSLSTLARVVGALARGRGEHVPCRDSVLTWLLSDAITGRTARAFMVATVHPGHQAETLSTLCYAREYSSLRSNLGGQILQLTSCVRRLQRLLATARGEFARACADGEGQTRGAPPWTMEALGERRMVRTRHRVREDFKRHPYLCWTDAHACKRSIGAVGVVQAEVDGPPPPRQRGEPKDGRRRRPRVAEGQAEGEGASQGSGLRLAQVCYGGKHGRPAQVLWYPARSLRDVPAPTHLMDLAEKMQRLEASLAAKHEELAGAKLTFLEQQRQWMGAS